jgi:hypothetical protein
VEGAGEGEGVGVGSGDVVGVGAGGRVGGVVAEVMGAAMWVDGAEVQQQKGSGTLNQRVGLMQVVNSSIDSRLHSGVVGIGYEDDLRHVMPYQWTLL